MKGHAQICTLTPLSGGSLWSGMGLTVRNLLWQFEARGASFNDP